MTQEIESDLRVQSAARRCDSGVGPHDPEGPQRCPGWTHSSLSLPLSDGSTVCRLCVLFNRVVQFFVVIALAPRMAFGALLSSSCQQRKPPTKSCTAVRTPSLCFQVMLFAAKKHGETCSKASARSVSQDAVQFSDDRCRELAAALRCATVASSMALA